MSCDKAIANQAAPGNGFARCMAGSGGGAACSMDMIAPGLGCVVAPNPGPLTGPGTNSYVLGRTRLCVIDPGPDDARHLAALLAAIAGRQVSHVLVSHAHLDHSALAPTLAAATGAPVCAFGAAGAGRSALMQRLAAQGLGDMGEGVDAAFAPDQTLRDGQVLQTGAGPLQVMHTPGHLGDHLAFGWGGALFVGDTVMGWSSSIVSPPDGDMGQYMASLARLAAVGATVLYSGHGAPVADPAARIAALTAHRRGREAAILAALTPGPATAAALTAAIYHDTAQSLWGAAQRNVLAHLIDLADRNLVTANPAPGHDARFALA